MAKPSLSIAPDRLGEADRAPVLHPNFTLKQLGYFVAAARHQSVVKAAEEIHVSPPSVSTAIAHLEAVMSVELFVRRHARGLVLTEAGRDVMAEARNILSQASDLESRRRDRSDRMEGRFELGCLPSVGPYLVPPMIRRFKAAYPNVDIRFHEGGQEDLFAGLEQGALELALLYDFDASSAVTCLPIRQMPILLTLPGTHPLAAHEAPALKDVIDEPFILLDQANTANYYLSVFSNLGLKPRVAHRVHSYEMVRGLVANGLGYSLLNFCPPSRLGARNALVTRPLAKPPGTNLVFAHLHQYRMNRIAKTFVEAATGFIRSLDFATLEDAAGHDLAPSNSEKQNSSDDK